MNGMTLGNDHDEQSAATRPDWSDVNALTRRVWIVQEGVWANVVPLKPREYAALIDELAELRKATDV